MPNYKKSKKGFFREDQKDKIPKKGPGYRLAGKLANAVRAKRKVQRPPDIIVWQQQMNEILDRESTLEEVEQVLDWYIANIDKDHVPQAYSAQGFSRKYKAIVDAMKRTNPKKTTSKLAPELRDLLKAARDEEDFQWPPGFVLEMPVVIERSHANYDRFLCAVRKFRDGAEPGNEIVEMLEYMFEAQFLEENPVDFVEGWLRVASRKLLEWDGFSGSPIPVIFRVDHRWFRPEALRIANEWCDWTLWTDLLKEIGED